MGILQTGHWQKEFGGGLKDRSRGWSTCLAGLRVGVNHSTTWSSQHRGLWHWRHQHYWGGIAALKKRNKFRCFSFSALVASLVSLLLTSPQSQANFAESLQEETEADPGISLKNDRGGGGGSTPSLHFFPLQERHSEHLVRLGKVFQAMELIERIFQGTRARRCIFVAWSVAGWKKAGTCQQFSPPVFLFSVFGNLHTSKEAWTLFPFLMYWGTGCLAVVVAFQRY